MTKMGLDPVTNINILKELCTKLVLNPILRDLTICQGILESRLSGKISSLAYNFNNLFGIKGKGTAGTVKLPTHEYINGKMVLVLAEFAKNNSVEDSIQQHIELLQRERYHNLAFAKTFEEAAEMIKNDGYATDPQYPNELISVYRQYCQPDAA